MRLVVLANNAKVSRRRSLLQSVEMNPSPPLVVLFWLRQIRALDRRYSWCTPPQDQKQEKVPSGQAPITNP